MAVLKVDKIDNAIEPGEYTFELTKMDRHIDESVKISGRIIGRIPNARTATITTSMSAFDYGTWQDLVDGWKRTLSNGENCRCSTNPHVETAIKKVIFNPPATIIQWNDGSKTVVKCQNGEPFDAEKGFVMAYLKKLLGNDNTFNKEISKWVVEDNIALNIPDNRPLSIEELMRMNGKKVWLSSMYDGKEQFDDVYAGWHTVNVKTRTLRAVNGNEYYDFDDYSDPMGFRAYLKPPKK